MGGIEPDGTKPESATAATESVLKYGDANCDGVVNIADAVLIRQYLKNPKKYNITKEGLKNADCVDSDGITVEDALAVQMLAAGKLSKKDLPTTKKKIKALNISRKSKIKSKRIILQKIMIKFIYYFI